jgi:hypothetical protein
MNYEAVKDAIRAMKFENPKDGFDRVFNLALDSAVRKVELLEVEDNLNTLQKEMAHHERIS